jgi:hypothetical protein
MKQSLYGKFLALFSKMFLAGLWGFLIGSSVTITGALANHLSPAFALVAGLAGGQMTAAVSMVATYRADDSGVAKKLGRIVIPSEEAAKELATDLQTIEKR